MTILKHVPLVPSYACHVYSGHSKIHSPAIRKFCLWNLRQPMPSWTTKHVQFILLNDLNADYSLGCSLAGWQRTKM